MKEKKQNEEQTLVELDTYLVSGIHIGTKYKTGYMKEFIYKIRHDGLAVLNVQKIDERIKIAAKMLEKYEPEEIMVVGKRENVVKAVKMFGKATGAKIVTGRYLPGKMTNPSYGEYYTEPKILIVCDQWNDRNAIHDALKIGIPIITLNNTNNTLVNTDLVIPCNNKSKKSIGLIFYILAREYLKSKGKELKMELSEFQK